MDMKSFIKSSPLSKLLEIQDLISQEIKLRRSKSRRAGHVVTFSDGAARGNPGPAGAGILVFAPNGDKLLEDYRYLGECTNNEAEYRALLIALDHAEKLTREKVECYMDSELLVRQLNGQYALKSEKLAPFFMEVRERCGLFSTITFTHVPREHANLRLADKLANKAIDEAKKFEM